MNKPRYYTDVNGDTFLPYAELLQSQAQRIPAQNFLSIDDDDCSYGELYRRALDISRGMIRLGIQPGDRIGILMPNCEDFFMAFFATQILGGIVVPVNARFKTHELSHVLNHANIRMLFTTDRIDEYVNFTELVWQTLPDLAGAASTEALAIASAPALRHIVLFGESPPSPALSIAQIEQQGAAMTTAELPSLPVAVSVDDIAVMLYTSGTTAMPKGCQLTHRGFYHSWISGYADTVALAEGEKVWNPLPFFHVGGIGPMTARRCRRLSAIHYDPAAAVRQIRDYQPQHLYPGFFTLLLPVLRDAGYDQRILAQTRSALNVAPYETQLQIKKLLPPGVKVLQVYAMTEASGYVTLTRAQADEEHRLKTSGTPLPGVELRICDPDNGEVLTAGSKGEIQFRGPVTFHSYYNDEAATRATLLDGGWVRSGDYGYVDEDGSTCFLGRIKDMLKVGGENVAAAEIEAYLGTHPAVKLAQVIASNDERLGEVPVAFIELLAGETATADELIEFCAGKLASFKLPREIIFVTEWPMSATKIQKFRLRERLSKPPAR